jgi:hypothetical protein
MASGNSIEETVSIRIINARGRERKLIVPVGNYMKTLQVYVQDSGGGRTGLQVSITESDMADVAEQVQAKLDDENPGWIFATYYYGGRKCTVRSHARS